MGDAARHLADRAQPLLFEHGLLGLAQIIIGLLEAVVQLRLIRSKPDMLAELPQELAIGAEEIMLAEPRDDHYAKDVAFHW
jgi:hypothetical protein